MVLTNDTHSATGDPGGPRLGAEGLDVYRLALEFQLLAMTLISRGQANLRDQLDRASVSIALNIAEAMCPHCLPMLDGHAKRGSWAR